MKRLPILITALLVCASPSWAVSASDILGRVKAAEAGVRDFRADMVITEANKKNVSGMGEGYGDILRLQKAVVQYKKPDKIRYDGFAQGIQLAYVQNGYTKLVFGAMIRQKENVKNAPGKRQDTLDLGFLGSRLWMDNSVSVVANNSNGEVKLKLDPKFGGDDKRHDFVWVDSKTLRVLKREKYRGSGELRIRFTYSDFDMLGGKLPIATTSTMYDPAGRELGSVKYKSLKSNVGLSDSLFSLDQR
ncbi:MAG: hypothetical protein M1133_11305 [Armatimonadetes bacterium]|nr:hypothetical protein [Armatimonadota bacterium]